MSTTRRKFSKEFKSKVVLESLKERETLESLAKKYELTPTQISIWRSVALKNFGNVFSYLSVYSKWFPKLIDYDCFFCFSLIILLFN